MSGEASPRSCGACSAGGSGRRPWRWEFLQRDLTRRQSRHYQRSLFPSWVCSGRCEISWSQTSTGQLLALSLSFASGGPPASRDTTSPGTAHLRPQRSVASVGRASSSWKERPAGLLGGGSWGTRPPEPGHLAPPDLSPTPELRGHLAPPGSPSETSWHGHCPKAPVRGRQRLLLSESPSVTA